MVTIEHQWNGKPEQGPCFYNWFAFSSVPTNSNSNINHQTIAKAIASTSQVPTNFKSIEHLSEYSQSFTSNYIAFSCIGVCERVNTLYQCMHQASCTFAYCIQQSICNPIYMMCVCMYERGTTSSISISTSFTKLILLHDRKNLNKM